MLEYYRLFDYLRKHNIHQKELLEKKIISRSTLQRLRNNDSVNTIVLIALCSYLNCKIEDIVEFVQLNEQK